MEKAFEELQLKDDFMFSVVMRNPKLCKPFLESFDLFGEGLHIYTFENRCVQNPELRLGDDATKMILNTKGTIDDITPEMKRVLDFIDGGNASDEYTRALEKEIESVRKNEKWRLDYMTLQMKYEEGIEQGMEIGIKAMIIDGMENDLDHAKIKSKLIRYFGLSPQMAEEYYDKYSVETVTGDLQTI